MNGLIRTALAAAAVLACAPAAHAADDAALRTAMERLAARVEALEKRNAELERALQSDRLSDQEPELATRVKAVEARTAAMAAPVERAAALEGITVEGSLVAVAQRAAAAATADGARQTRASYRGDLEVGLPVGEWGATSASAFVHLRFGQGEGVALRPSYTSTPNSTAFEVAGDPDSSFAVLAQAGLQFERPLGGAGDNTKRRLQLTLGKLDAFGFFDGNAVADDEASRFLNNAFVHNPLLDSGGDVGADAYGFAPGAVVKLIDEHNPAAGWTLSLGAFGAGGGANFSGSLGRPFVIAQAETSVRLGQLPGTYRFYAWTNGQAVGFDGVERRHRGLGLSIDQQVHEDLTLFARWGHGSRGEPRFDRALTVGGEWVGNAWGRGADALGLAWGRLRTAPGFAAGSATVDADGDGTPDWGYAASGSETLLELYYRWNLGNGVELTPDFQLVRRAGGDGSAPTARVWGLRAKWGF